MPENLTLLEKAALLSGDTVWQTRSVPRIGMRALWLADGPHGVRKQSGSADHLGLGASLPATCFPTAATVANSWDPEIAEMVGGALGAEAAAQGVDVLLGPGLNIKRSPVCGRNFEYLSEDPYLAGKVAAGYVRGIQSRGVAACPKHFAANNQELRRMVSDSVVDERTLREIYLTGFEIAVREGHPYAIMSAYNKINGTYAHENAWLLQQVLQREWGYDGAVVSDWGGGNDPVEAVRTGGTLEMPAPGFDSAIRIVEAVESGLLTEADVDARVDEVRALVRRVDERPTTEDVDADAHHGLARIVAAASAVLLKNDDDLLPLRSGTRVAVVGDFAGAPRYQGAGSSQVNPTRLTTALGALPASGLEVVEYAKGFVRGAPSDPALVAQAVDAASRADVVLAYLGLDEVSEIEGRDREHLRLPPAQVDLLTAVAAANPLVVVVLTAGGVVEMPWLDSCTALLHGYLGGQAGAEALIDVITGKVNPSGRLAETYPVRLEDTPAHRYHPSGGATAEYREGPYVGYRYYTTVRVPVTFPFGFGLSYTTFAYSDLVVDTTGASFTVTNTGRVAGAEVTQLYVGRDEGAEPGVFRPARELKGFAKVHLRPGESRRVVIRFDEYSFRHFSIEAARWENESGTYLIQVGASVEDIRLAERHEVAGSVGPRSSDVSSLPHYCSGDVTDVPDEEFATLLGRPPASRKAADGPLGRNDPLAAMRHAANPIARFAERRLARLIDRADAKGKPDLNLLFIYWEPFRAIGKMTNGLVSMAMVDALLLIVNGHSIRGLGALLRGTVVNVRTNRRARRALANPRS